MEISAKDGDTAYVQWSPPYEKDIKWPQVELLENFLFIHTNPNDSWRYIKSGEARIWRLFPNSDERHIPW